MRAGGSTARGGLARSQGDLLARLLDHIDAGIRLRRPLDLPGSRAPRPSRPAGPRCGGWPSCGRRWTHVS